MLHISNLTLCIVFDKPEFENMENEFPLRKDRHLENPFILDTNLSDEIHYTREGLSLICPYVAWVLDEPVIAPKKTGDDRTHHGITNFRAVHIYEDILSDIAFSKE